MGSTKSSNTKNDKKLLKTIIFLFPIVFIFIIILDKIILGPLNPDYVKFAREDGPIEYGTSILYYFSFLVSGTTSYFFIKQKKNLFAIFAILLSIAFFFIASEEISWGQRIFDLDTPDFFESNVQNELNFHNLPEFEKYKRNLILLAGLLGFVFWAVFTHIDKIKVKPFTNFFIPQRYVMSYFILIIIFYTMDIFSKYLPKSSEGFLLYIFIWPDHEVFEFLLSVGFFIFVFSQFFKVKNQRKISN